MRVADLDRIRSLVTVNPTLGDASAIYDLLHRTGAVLEGHFALQSGQHSRCFLRFRQIGRSTAEVDYVASRLLEIAPFVPRRAQVLCPESAGFYLGHAVSQRIEGRLAVLKIDEHRRPGTELRTGALAKSAPLIIVNDVVTTGHSLQRLISAAGAHGVRPVGAVVFATLRLNEFNQSINDLGLRATYVIAATDAWETFPEQQCPLCGAKDRPLPAAEFN
jgi:orotate phosphoribosyltransferase